jgi:hypothetical protein
MILLPRRAEQQHCALAARRWRRLGSSRTRNDIMSIGTILLVILIIALLGGFSGLGGGRFYGTGYYGGGGLGLVVVVLLVLVLLGKL